LSLGAKVAGYSLNIPTQPANFETLGLASQITHIVGDVRDRSELQKAINAFQPEIVFHLAAQPLTRLSYDYPQITFETNTLGTLNILECVRNQSSIHAVIIITSDKCYRNDEWIWGYRENDRLGGNDPYSASKAAAEIICNSYMQSFFKNGRPAVATTRAGNVIGGGDWAMDRIVPDCIRAWSKGEKVKIRNPRSRRPWQHVLEAISGYICLGASLLNGIESVRNEAFNFGPAATVIQSVEELISELAQHWQTAKWEIEPEVVSNKIESGLLKLNCDKALHHLNWHAILSTSEAIDLTSKWYKTYYSSPKSIPELTREQIKDYTSRATKKELPWATL
jgi:CDP-glucose 4,6-dehydratase